MYSKINEWKLWGEKFWFNFRKNFSANHSNIIKYLLSTYYVPGTDLDSGDLLVNKHKNSFPSEVYFLLRQSYVLVIGSLQTKMADHREYCVQDSCLEWTTPTVSKVFKVSKCMNV